MEDPNNYRSDNESDFQNSNKFNQIEEENQTFGIKRKETYEYEKKIQELLEKNDILETRLKVMGEQKYKLVSKLKNSEDENDILKDQIIKQNNNNKQLNSDNEKYQKEIIELKTSNKELNEKARDKIESINKELEDKQKQLENLTQKLKAKDETIKYFTVNNESTQRNTNTIREELENEKKINQKQQDKILELEKKIDQMYLQRQSEGSLILEIQHLKDDNMRLLQMLKTTEEFKNFAYLNEAIPGGVKLIKDNDEQKKINSVVSFKLKDKSVIQKSQENIKDNQSYIPNEAYDLAVQFKNKYNGELNDNLINELLSSINKIYKTREKKEMNKIKNKYQNEINELKRKLSMRSGYDEFISQKTIAKLKKDLKKTKDNLKDKIDLNNKLKNSPAGMDLVDNALKVASNFENTKKIFENEIANLKKRLADKDELSGSHQQYNQGILWMISRSYEEINSLEKNVNELFKDYEERVKNSNLISGQNELMDYNMRIINNSVKWFFNSLKQMIIDIRDKFSNWKFDAQKNLNNVKINSNKK